MRNIYTKITTATMVLLLTVSCNSRHAFTKEQYINKFEAFISTTESYYMTYDNNGWKKANAQFKDLSETDYNRFEKEMSTEERLKIDRLIGRYYSFVAKYQATQVQEKLKRIYNQAEGFIDNLSK
ncbi:MAG: hypothetical protein KDE33_12705 [Bacteroidetes bacterium]|nr:hypothetical protein [Bacteroidota bacterium]